MLLDFASNRVGHDQVVGLARCDDQPAVGAERDGLGPHARQLHLNARGGQDLIGRRVVTVRPGLPDSFTG